MIITKEVKKMVLMLMPVVGLIIAPVAAGVGIWTIIVGGPLGQLLGAALLGIAF